MDSKEEEVLSFRLGRVESAGHSSTDMSTEMAHARQILNQSYRLAKNLLSMQEKGIEEDSLDEYEKTQALSKGLMKISTSRLTAMS